MTEVMVSEAQKVWRRAGCVRRLGSIAAALLVAVGVTLFARPTMSEPQAARQARPAGMTNADVIKLAGAAFSDSLIIARIDSAPTKRFDLTADGLVQLKQGGVSERVISVMLGGVDPGAVAAPLPRSAAQAGRADSSVVEPPATSPPVDQAVEEAGIYSLAGHQRALLEPTVFSGGKTGGVFMSGVTMGIKKMKWKAVVRSPRATRRLTTAHNQEFLFVFERLGSGLSNAGAMLGASSPNEFVLARMDPTETERQLVVGEMGAFGGSAGTRSQDTVELTIERLSPGRYRVVPRQPLPRGEYCFFYAAGMSGFMASGSGKVFDFGVDEQ
ncbi:hypothetical protein [Luteitalea sp.]|uniref:hypothetical protein n=1 Tax=Luteitalea sp. TaxID=2004800 RepID=UPI0025BD9248|nr:hypothetical protein [Luteitalea sp.]